MILILIFIEFQNEFNISRFIDFVFPYGNHRPKGKSGDDLGNYLDEIVVKINDFNLNELSVIASPLRDHRPMGSRAIVREII